MPLGLAKGEERANPNFLRLPLHQWKKEEKLRGLYHIPKIDQSWIRENDEDFCTNVLEFL